MKTVIEKGNWEELEKERKEKKENRLKKYNYKTTCDCCGCKYVFEYDDVCQERDVTYIVCPQCKRFNFIHCWFIHRHKKIK